MLKRMFFLIAIAMWAAAPLARAADEHATHDASQKVEAAVNAHGEANAEGHGEAHGAGHAKPPLLPPLDDSETWKQALWVVIIFLALLAILYPTAWKNVLAGLKAREQRIRADIAEAEATRKRAEKTLAEYNTQLAAAEGKVRDMIAKAATDAERIAAGIRTQAQQEAEEIKERTARDLDAAKNQAISEIYAEAATLATNVAEKILRRNLNANDQRDLVAQSLEQLQTVSKR